MVHLHCRIRLARTALPRIRTDQILEFGWRAFLAVLQVVLSLFIDASALDFENGGWPTYQFESQFPATNPNNRFWLVVFGPDE